MSETVKLTQYSHGAGCGCKISPAALQRILSSDFLAPKNSALLVGNESCDDAAVYQLDEQTCLISTTDFFMPIVDDPSEFGAIASANAISDVYAMGGEPLMAIAILGWPINKIPPEVAQQVMDGARKICAEADIPLAGGHSIDCPEPIFGLAVTGKVQKKYLKRNNAAHENSLLYLTKPLGVGIIATAQKNAAAKPEHLKRAVRSMLTLNKAGAAFGKMEYVNALTDVTGFGLLGHLIEMAEGSGLSAEIDFAKAPKFDFLDEYLAQNFIPGGTKRNLDSYRFKVENLTEKAANILADPQTSGGLLASVDKSFKEDFERECEALGLSLTPFGEMRAKKNCPVNIRM